MIEQASLLSVRGLGKKFGGFKALNGFDLDIAVGERIGVIGPNGAGKSTLVNCLSGALSPDQGSIMLNGEMLNGLTAHQRARRGLTRSFQLPRPFKSMSVLQNILVPIIYARQGRGGPVFQSAGAEIEAREILVAIGLGSKADAPVISLTQVEMRKLELARAMAAKPKLLLSDEAMAGLSDSEVDEILELLFEINRGGVAIVMIEHIIKAVTAFSQRIVVLVAGEKIADGLPQDVMRLPEVERAYLGE
ncbi:MAG: ABC transporter ATP-binding protein [Tardiphaga sp.]|jgi:branched-chain amino acid transport system ATP-binding protein|nr:ABC transporter ATP-binding protein [Tardiphaga sp.]